MKIKTFTHGVIARSDLPAGQAGATKQSFNRLWFAFANHFNPTQSVGLRFARNDTGATNSKLLIFLILFLPLFSTCAYAADLTVAAAANLQYTLEELKTSFEKKNGLKI